MPFEQRWYQLSNLGLLLIRTLLFRWFVQLGRDLRWRWFVKFAWAVVDRRNHITLHKQALVFLPFLNLLWSWPFLLELIMVNQCWDQSDKLHQNSILISTKTQGATDDQEICISLIKEKDNTLVLDLNPFFHFHSQAKSLYIFWWFHE